MAVDEKFLLENFYSELIKKTVYVLVCIDCGCRTPEYMVVNFLPGMNPTELFITQNGVVLCDEELYSLEPFKWFNPVSIFFEEHNKCQEVYRVKTNRSYQSYMGMEFEDPEVPQWIHDNWNRYPIDFCHIGNDAKNKIIKLRSQFKDNNKSKIVLAHG